MVLYLRNAIFLFLPPEMVRNLYDSIFKDIKNTTNYLPTANFLLEHSNAIMVAL